MSKANDMRNASHLVAHISAMLRKASAPSEKEWKHLQSLFSADAAFEVSNRLIDAANKMDAREKAA